MSQNAILNAWIERWNHGFAAFQKDLLREISLVPSYRWHQNIPNNPLINLEEEEEEEELNPPPRPKEEEDQKDREDREREWREMVALEEETLRILAEEDLARKRDMIRPLPHPFPNGIPVKGVPLIPRQPPLGDFVHHQPLKFTMKPAIPARPVEQSIITHSRNQPREFAPIKPFQLISPHNNDHPPPTPPPGETTTTHFKMRKPKEEEQEQGSSGYPPTPPGGGAATKHFIMGEVIPDEDEEGPQPPPRPPPTLPPKPTPVIDLNTITIPHDLPPPTPPPTNPPIILPEEEEEKPLPRPHVKEEDVNPYVPPKPKPPKPPKPANIVPVPRPPPTPPPVPIPVPIHPPFPDGDQESEHTISPNPPPPTPTPTPPPSPPIQKRTHKKRISYRELANFMGDRNNIIDLPSGMRIHRDDLLNLLERHGVIRPLPTPPVIPTPSPVPRPPTPHPTPAVVKEEEEEVVIVPDRDIKKIPKGEKIRRGLEEQQALYDSLFTDVKRPKEEVIDVPDRNIKKKEKAGKKSLPEVKLTREKIRKVLDDQLRDYGHTYTNSTSRRVKTETTSTSTKKLKKHYTNIAPKPEGKGRKRKGGIRESNREKLQIDEAVFKPSKSNRRVPAMPRLVDDQEAARLLIKRFKKKTRRN